MTNKTILGAIVAAALLGGSVMAADAAAHFGDIIKANLNENDDALNSLQIKTGAKIPIGDINHGFGIITDGSADGAALVGIVTTTHPDLGFIDSEDQTSPTDPVEHNHVVALENGVSECQSGLAVLDLTFESPGTTNVQSTHVGMNNIPYGQYDGQFGTSIASGDDPAGPGIVSFQLTVENERVCVNVVSTASP